MKNSEMQSQKILNYLHGELNQQEANEIEKELKENPQLMKELMLQQEIDRFLLKESKVKAFREKLELIHEKEVVSKKSKVLNLQNKWYWAAASVTLISGTAIYSLSEYNRSTDRLYNKYYEIWQPALIARSADGEQKIQTILAQFESGNFAGTLNSIEQLPVNEQNSPNLWLIKGCALMEVDEFGQAVDVFKNFDSGTYTLYTESGQWYKALCYLKMDQMNEAKKQLRDISNKNNSYSKDALDILKKLK
jgi:hypothetical protein